LEKTIEIQLQELREKIANDIENLDLTDAAKISGDAFMASLRMRTIASITARGK
jgi:ribosomal silencing factor RsfS